MNNDQLEYARLTQRLMGTYDELQALIQRTGHDPLGLLPEVMSPFDGQMIRIDVREPVALEAPDLRPAAKMPPLESYTPDTPEEAEEARREGQTVSPAPQEAQEPAPDPPVTPTPPDVEHDTTDRTGPIIRRTPITDRLREAARVREAVLADQAAPEATSQVARAKPGQRKEEVLAEVRRHPGQTASAIATKIETEATNVMGILSGAMREDPPKVSRRGKRGDYRWFPALPPIPRPE